MGEIDRIQPTFAPPTPHRGSTPYVAGREGRRHGSSPEKESPTDQLDLSGELGDVALETDPPTHHETPPEAGLDLSV